MDACSLASSFTLHDRVRSNKVTKRKVETTRISIEFSRSQWFCGNCPALTYGRGMNQIFHTTPPYLCLSDMMLRRGRASSSPPCEGTKTCQRSGHCPARAVRACARGGLGAMGPSVGISRSSTTSLSLSLPHPFMLPQLPSPVPCTPRPLIKRPSGRRGSRASHGVLGLSGHLK